MAILPPGESGAAVDIAILTLLRGDAALTALAPGGIFRDQSPENVVNPSAGDDPGQVFGLLMLREGRRLRSLCPEPALEKHVFGIVFVAPATASSGAQEAIDRADVLLDAGPLPLPPAYRLEACVKTGVYRDITADDPIRWQVRGSYWEVWGAWIL